MPRLVTPSSNPYANASHTLTPYTRRERSSMSPANMSSSDKENASPSQQQREPSTQKFLASQAAFREKLGENINSQYYDPFQSREKVRDITQQYRRLIQETNECRAELVKPGNNGILETVEKADEIFVRDVRTTGTANLDSKLLVNSTDLAHKRARNMDLGDATFNVDEYVSKLVSFMGGRHLVGGNDRGREDSMDWAELGRAAMGICRRPPTIGFILGPLSVEKKERKTVRKQAERRDDTKVVRPQELKEGDIQRQENATSHMVRLVADLLRRNSPINLFEFVINPRSFGQTIENIFYLSFSVQLARAKIAIENGLPVVSFIDTLDEHQQALENKQCVLEMTMHQYEQLIKAFNITDSIIPHRDEETQTTSAQTWY